MATRGGYGIRTPDKIGSVPRIPIYREIQSNMPTTSNLCYLIEMALVSCPHAKERRSSARSQSGAYQPLA